MSNTAFTFSGDHHFQVGCFRRAFSGDEFHCWSFILYHHSHVSKLIEDQPLGPKSSNNNSIIMQYSYHGEDSHSQLSREDMMMDQHHQHPGSSAMSVHSRMTMSSRRTSAVLTDAEESELLSRATSQAMIAARSIILSGGSHATALSTAKAAAQSILVPNTSELEGPTLGKVFLSRRKAKRQAEVVASMAMLSVKQQTMLQPISTVQQSQQLEAASFMQGSVASNHPSYATPSGKGGEGGGSFTSSPPPPGTVMNPHGNAPSLRGMGTYDNNNHSFDHSYDRSYYERAPSRSYDRSYEEGRTRNSKGVTMLQPQLSSSAKWFGTSHQGPPTQSNPRNHDEGNKLTDSPRNTKLPGLLPKSRIRNAPKTRDLAKGVPEEDPIYTSTSNAVSARDNNKNNNKYETFSGGDSSSGGDSHNTDESGTFGSGTFGSDTVEPATVAPPLDLALDGEHSFMHSTVDPFFATIANVFFCGSTPPTATPNPTAPNDNITQQSRDRAAALQESRHDEDDDDEDDDRESSSESEDDEDRRHPSHDRSARRRGDRSSRERAAAAAATSSRSRQPPRKFGSHSTADSSQLLKELNLSSTDEDAPPAAAKATKDKSLGFLNTGSSIRESMEQVVLRALSGTLQTPVASPTASTPTKKTKPPPTPTPPTASETQMTITVDNNESKEVDCMSATSSLSASKSSRMTLMAQRVKFRRWMRRRRGRLDE